MADVAILREAPEVIDAVVVDVHASEEPATRRPPSRGVVEPVHAAVREVRIDEGRSSPKPALVSGADDKARAAALVVGPSGVAGDKWVGHVCTPVPLPEPVLHPHDLGAGVG